MTDEPRLPPVEEVKALRAAACDWRLSRGDVGVFAVILEHANAKGEAFPGPALIAKKARLAVTNVKGCIRKLEALHFISVIRPGMRKKNKYVVTFKPLPVMPRLAGIPSQLKRELTKRKGVSSHQHAQFSQGRTHPTGDARMHSTGDAGMNDLGMLARQEVTFKSPSEDTGASRSFQGSEEQERSPEEEARLTASARSAYEHAKNRGATSFMDSLERDHWHRIADLVPKGRLPPLVA